MNISVGPLSEPDLPAADRIYRLAFGTWHHLPDPLAFAGDTAAVRTRWRADPSASLGARIDGELVASNFVTHCGSVGLLGPLTVHPRLWDRGVAKHLLEATMELFSSRGVRHAGLFTHPESPKHISLYQKFGFWPQFLIAVLAAPVKQTEADRPFDLYSGASESGKAGMLEACRSLTVRIFDGLDVTREIQSVDRQGLGDTLLIRDGSDLEGFAVCHAGPGTEAGSGTCKIKFGAARPGAGAWVRLDRVLDAANAYAAAHGASRILTTINTARREAYARMLERGFRIEIVGVSMCRPDEPGFNRPDVFVVDEWR